MKTNGKGFPTVFRPLFHCPALSGYAVIRSEWEIRGNFLTQTIREHAQVPTTTLSCCTNAGLGERAVCSSGLPSSMAHGATAAGTPCPPHRPPRSSGA